MLFDGSHALRGNPSWDAPRPADAERLWLHAHAERGNDRVGRVKPAWAGGAGCTRPTAGHTDNAERPET
ncbi:conserved hypothetical protein [Pseudomonas sp. 8AS]|nr:conserved hypothetical protein [Pseudomonas sp. 8AS]